MEIQIKKFNELSLDELYQILKLRVDVFVVEQNCPYPEIDNLDQEAVHLFIKEADFIKGYLRIYYKSTSQVAIGRVIAHSDFRKDGIGRLLMTKSLEYLKEQKVSSSIYLQAQDHLANFYASFGFERTSEVYPEDGIPHVDMELEI